MESKLIDNMIVPAGLPGYANQTLAMTFDGTFDGTFTRSTVAWNSETGASTAINTPRYLSGRSGQGLLVESSSTQIINYSNIFSSWTPVGGIGSNQDAVDRFGSANSAWTLTDSSAGNVSLYVQSKSLTTGLPYTYSVWFKRTSGATSFPVLYVTSGTRIGGCTIDTNNATVTAWTAYTGFTIDPTSAVIAETIGDWLRVSLTVTPGATASWTIALAPAARTSGTSATGTNETTAQGSNIFSDSQLEQQFTASSNIINTSVGTVTRGADTASNPTSGVVSQPGTIQGWWKPQSVATGKTQTLWSTYTDASNSTALQYFHGTGFVLTKRVGGTSTTVTSATAASAGTWYMFDIIYNANNTMDLYINAVQAETNATTTTGVPVIATTMQQGAFNSTLQADGTIDNYRWFSRILTSAEMTTYLNRGK